jgi:hypothetical protein
MASTYTISETAHTEESKPYSRKEYAVRDAEAAAEEYPGTPFHVTTGSGKRVHTALAESDEAVDAPAADAGEEPQDAPVADVTTAEGFADLVSEIIAKDETPADADEADAPADGDDPAKEEEGDDEASAPAEALAAATLELCAANTNARRMHYRTIGGEVSLCASAATTRRANAHQIETAGMCPACEKLLGDQQVDRRPAGEGRGTRKSPKRLIVDASTIRDLVAHLKQGVPYAVDLTDGTRLEIAAGDPAEGTADDAAAEMLTIRIVEG